MCQPPEGQNPAIVVRRKALQTFKRVARVGQPPLLLVEHAKRKECIGNDPSLGIAAADQIQNPGIFRFLPAREQPGRFLVERLVDSSSVLGDDCLQAIGDQQVGSHQTMTIGGGNRQAAQPIMA